jgi:ferritin-like metal-binding protein YciE
MDTPRELFLHELSDLLSAEHIIAKTLGELAKETQHDEMKTAFKEHGNESKEQVKRLEQAFKLLGEKPEDVTCHAAEGLRKEHEELHEENPSPEVLEMGNLLGAAKTEHYEIASYTGLVQIAKDLGEREVADLLKQNLDEETAMAKRIVDFTKTVGKEAKQELKEQEKAEKQAEKEEAKANA